MEIKRKDENYVSKDRIPILYTEINNFMNNMDLTKISNHTIEYEKRIKAAKNFFFYFSKNKLKPLINVVYEREAFECKFGSGLRVTFDINIRSFLTQTYDNLFDNAEMEILYPSHFVLEIKYYRALPSWVPKLINKYDLKKEAISKYALSMDYHLRNKIFVHFI